VKEQADLPLLAQEDRRLVPLGSHVPEDVAVEVERMREVL
jgi:hypothetical protein